LPAEQGRLLVEDWVIAGGGATFDPASEADAFLGFVASHLSDPSHELTICRMEQATYRAGEAALRFRRPDPSLLDHPAALLRSGKRAALVQFFAEPEQLLGAVAANEPLPPLSDECYPILFAPGLPTLFRPADNEETAIWKKLARPTTARLLLRDSNARNVIERLLSVGAAELIPLDPMLSE
jgi:hypothetical protein